MMEGGIYMIINYDGNNFNDIIKTRVLVDFYANWCGPCKMLSPVLEKLGDEVKILKVNVDEYQDLAREYKVMSIPCLILFDEQKELKGVVDDTLLNWLIDIFEVDLSLLCKEMSLGMKRKLAIVSAFMSDPDIIIMDEPSSGLDPEMQEVFVELIKLEKRRGKTILLSSHIFEEVDAVCERIAVIKDGVIVSLLDANDLKHKSIKEYHISYKNIEDKNNAIIILKKNDFHVEQPFENENIVIVKCDETRTNEFLKVLPPSFIDFLEKKETLEDYFMSFYKEDKTYVGL